MSAKTYIDTTCKVGQRKECGEVATYVIAVTAVTDNAWTGEGRDGGVVALCEFHATTPVSEWDAAPIDQANELPAGGHAPGDASTAVAGSECEVAAVPSAGSAGIDQADEAAKEDTTPMSETSEQKPCGRGICLRESGHGGTCDEASFGVAPEQRRHYLKGDDCSCGFAAGLGSTCTCQPVTSEDAS